MICQICEILIRTGKYCTICQKELDAEYSAFINGLLTEPLLGEK